MTRTAAITGFRPGLVLAWLAVFHAALYASLDQLSELATPESEHHHHEVADGELADTSPSHADMPSCMFCLDGVSGIGSTSDPVLAFSYYGPLPSGQSGTNPRISSLGHWAHSRGPPGYS